MVGAGGREHALVWKLAQSPRVADILVAPGSDGMAREPKTRCAPIAVGAVRELAELAAREAVDLTVVGPEQPLVAGLADAFQARGLAVFGPARGPAQLEGSKAFAKDFMVKHTIPTARYRVFDKADDAFAFMTHEQMPFVVKADGLASGKGVVVPATTAQSLEAVRAMMVQGQFGDAGRRIVLEERLRGEEASVIGVADGHRILLLESAQDHKRLRDHDEGPNTGGMGAYSPAPVITAALQEEIRRRIMEPTIAGMAEAETPFIGALYAGLMITEDGPKVLEYNVRFGDPETQAVLPRLRTDLAELLFAASRGDLRNIRLSWDPRPCVCVVLAAPGYPENPVTGQMIRGLERLANQPDVQVFHAGTTRQQDQWVTAGGRVLNLVATGDSFRAAIARAYEAVEQIQFDGMQYRRDIGARAAARELRRVRA